MPDVSSYVVRRAEPETAEGAMKMKLLLLLLMMMMMMMMNGMAIDIAMIAMGMTLEKWLEGHGYRNGFLVTMGSVLLGYTPKVAPLET